MHRKWILALTLFLAACSPPLPTLVPVDQIVAQTMAALPKTDTPAAAPTLTPIPEGVAAEGTPQAGPAFSEAGADCLPAKAERTQARVTRVIDGDTIEVAIGNSVFPVRYLGIDSPAAAAQVERLGPEAAAMNKRFVGSQVVTLVKDAADVDEYGRLLRYVLAGGVFVNYELVRQGFASAAASPADLACKGAFLIAESEARGLLTGLWAPTAIPTATRKPAPVATELPEDFTEEPDVDPVCDCEGRKLTCNDFTRQGDAQACFDYCKAEDFGDIFKMDKNDNKLACEGLP